MTTREAAAPRRSRLGGLPLRLLSGAGVGAVCLALLLVGRGGVYALAAAVALLALWELRGVFAHMGLPAAAWLMLPLGIYFCLGPVLVPELSPTVPLVAAVVAGLVVLVLFPRSGEGWTGWAMAMGGSLYIGLPLSYYLLLYTRAGGRGLPWLLAVLLAVVASDTAAYLVGSRFGRRPFFTRISPQKTVEGAVAGWLGAGVVTVVAGYALFGLNPVHGVVLGLLIGAAAELGDLVESQLKRRAGLKDSSHLIPGHGGLLDRIDSALFPGLVAYFYAVLFHLL